MPQDLTRRTCLGALALAAGAAPATARAQAATVDSAALQADADLLRHAYTTLHPGLLRYQTQPQAEARFATLRHDLGLPRSLAEAYVALSRATAAVRCGHSFLNPANQDGAGLALIAGSRDRLPFRFAWLRGHMIVLDGAGAHRLLRAGGGGDVDRRSRVPHAPARVAAAGPGRRP